jgi:hypothetical protein
MGETSEPTAWTLPIGGLINTTPSAHPELNAECIHRGWPLQAARNQ